MRRDSTFSARQRGPAQSREVDAETTHAQSGEYNYDFKSRGGGRGVETRQRGGQLAARSDGDSLLEQPSRERFSEGYPIQEKDVEDTCGHRTTARHLLTASLISQAFCLARGRRICSKLCPRCDSVWRDLEKAAGATVNRPRLENKCQIGRIDDSFHEQDKQASPCVMGDFGGQRAT